MTDNMGLNNLIKALFILIYFIVGLGLSTEPSFAQDYDNRGIRQMSRVLDLRGIWKFSIGDHQSWKEDNFDDGTWEEIFVPSSWEDEGYPGYDGYAWYRKKFVLSKNLKNKDLYLRLGYIDDVDEVYVNGQFVGFSGNFPPNYFTAHHLERIYKLPQDYLNYDTENTIAIRIYDAEITGGIISGKVGVYEMNYDIPIEILLEGLWKFSPGDDQARKEVDYNDWDWKDVIVPASWETQGFKNYDGYAWYRKKIVIPEDYRNSRLVLLLGKIDDLDETYLNGHLIGKTGDMSSLALLIDEEWLENRGYLLDNTIINYGSENVLAVRVFDGLVQGGIYQGPVGITTEENYKKWQSKNKKGKSIFDFLFNN